jgi:hypothetical protein
MPKVASIDGSAHRVSDKRRHTLGVERADTTKACNVFTNTALALARWHNSSERKHKRRTSCRDRTRRRRSRFPNARLLELLLTRDGHRVQRAHDGIEALQMVSREQPDRILMDVRMLTSGSSEWAIRTA